MSAKPFPLGIEYDGRWKVLHYTAADIYSHVIIAPYYNITTGNLEAWVTSDLWDSISGTATFTWLDWSGAKLNISTPSQTSFTLGAINSTRVLHTNVSTALSGHDLTNVVLKLDVQAEGTLPNSDVKTTFRHENWFHASPLNTVKLQDPGLKVSYSKEAECFNVSASTGVAAWVWLDYPDGAVVSFDSNAFWLAPGEERQVGYRVKVDQTGGKWIDGVTVQSIWNQTLAE